MNSEFYLIIATLLTAFLVFLIFKSINERINKYKSICESENETLMQLVYEYRAEKESYKEYISFFSTYFNEDWSRNTPFLKKIEALSIYVPNNRFEKVFPLKTLVKDIEFNNKSKEELNSFLKTIFKDNFDIIQNMYLVQLLMFIADLKSYDGVSHPEEYSTPEEYYKWRIEWYTKINENGKNN